MAYGLLGLALAAIGTGLSMASSAKASSDMNKAALRQLQKIDDSQAANKPLFEKSLVESGADKTKGRLEQSQEIAEGMYGEGMPDSGGALPIDQHAVGGKVGQARQAASLGQSYREVMTQDWIRNQETARLLGVNNNLASSAEGVAPILTQLAGNRSAGLAGLGSLMSTAGSLASVYGGLKSGQNVQTGTKVGGHSNNETIEVKG